MSILDRIGRIAKANINWLLNKIELPEQELQARISELEEAIVEGKTAAATYGASFRRLDKEAQDLRGRQAQFQQDAAKSVQTGDDDAAWKFLDKKVRLEERITNLTPGIEEGRKTYNVLRDGLVRLQDQLAQAKLKLSELKTRQRTATARKAFGQAVETTSNLTDGGAMFERMEDHVLQTEAEADVAEDMLLGDIDLEQRSRELQIESELASLKGEMSRE